MSFFLREDVSHCKALLLRTFLGFDLRLVRLVLVSVFSLSPGPSGSIKDWCVCPNLDVRFDSPPWFFAICCTKDTTRPTGSTRLRPCVGVVLTLVTSVSIDTSFISAASDTPTNVLCLRDAAVRSPQVNSSPSEPCSLSLQLASLRRA